MTQRNMVQWSLFIVLLGQWTHPLLAVNLQRMCVGRPLGALLPNPVDCNSYYVCEGEPKLALCDPGLHFDRVNKVCNWPRWANCRLGQLDTDESIEQTKATHSAEDNIASGVRPDLQPIDDEDAPDAGESGTSNEPEKATQIGASESQTTLPKPEDTSEQVEEIPSTTDFKEQEDVHVVEGVQPNPFVDEGDASVKVPNTDRVDDKKAGAEVILQSQESEKQSEPVNKAEDGDIESEVVDASNLEPSSSSKPPSNIGQTAKIEIGIAADSAGLKASNSSTPPPNSSLLVKLPIAPGLKLPIAAESSSSTPPSNSSILVELPISAGLKASNNSGPQSNSSISVEIPIAAELGGLKASNSSKPPSNYSKPAELPNASELSEIASNNSKPPAVSNFTMGSPFEEEDSTLKVIPSLNSTQAQQATEKITEELSDLKPLTSSRPPSNSSLLVELPISAGLKASSSPESPSNSSLPNDLPVAEDFSALKAPSNSNQPVVAISFNGSISILKDLRPSLDLPANGEPSSLKAPSNSSQGAQVPVAVPHKSTHLKPLPGTKVSTDTSKPPKDSTQAQTIEIGALESSLGGSSGSALIGEKIVAGKPTNEVIELVSEGRPLEPGPLAVQPQAQAVVEKVSPSQESPNQVIEIINSGLDDHIVSQGEVVVEKVEAPQKLSNQVIDVTSTGFGDVLQETLPEVEKVQVASTQQGSGKVIEITNPIDVLDALSVAPVEKVDNKALQGQAATVHVVEQFGDLTNDAVVNTDVDWSHPTPKSPQKKLRKKNNKKQTTAIESDEESSEGMSNEVDTSRASDEIAAKPSRQKKKGIKKKKASKKPAADKTPDDDSDEATDLGWMEEDADNTSLASGEDVATPSRQEKKGTKKKKASTKPAADKTPDDDSDEATDLGWMEEDADNTSLVSGEDVATPSRQKKKGTKKKKASKKPATAKIPDDNSAEGTDLESVEEDADNTSLASGEDATTPSRKKKKGTKKKKISKAPTKTVSDEIDDSAAEEPDQDTNSSQSSEKTSSKPTGNKRKRRPKKTKKDSAEESEESGESDEMPSATGSLAFPEFPGDQSFETFQSDVVKVAAPERQTVVKDVSQVFESQPASMVLDTFQSNAVKVVPSPKETAVKEVPQVFEAQPSSMALDTFQSNAVKVVPSPRETAVKDISQVVQGQSVDMILDTFHSNAVKVEPPAKANSVKQIVIESQGPLYMPSVIWQSNAVKVSGSGSKLPAANVIEVQSPQTASSFINNLMGSGPNTLSALSNKPSTKKESDHTNLSVSILSVASVRHDDDLNSTVNRPIVGAHNSQTGHPIQAMNGYNIDNIQCIHDGLYFLPHPSDCQKYFICAYRHLHLHSCGDTLTWSYKQEQCELLSEARCFSRQTKVASVKPENVNNPAKQQTSTTSASATTTTEASTPMPPLRTTETAKEAKHTNLTEYNNLDEHTEQESRQLPSCPTFRQVYLPSTDDCNKYYICILGEAVLTSCPDNLFWDAKGEFCGQESEVKCARK